MSPPGTPLEDEDRLEQEQAAAMSSNLRLRLKMSASRVGQGEPGAARGLAGSYHAAGPGAVLAETSSFSSPGTTELFLFQLQQLSVGLKNPAGLQPLEELARTLVVQVWVWGGEAFVTEYDDEPEDLNAEETHRRPVPLHSLRSWRKIFESRPPKLESCTASRATGKFDEDQRFQLVLRLCPSLMAHGMQRGLDGEVVLDMELYERLASIRERRKALQARAVALRPLAAAAWKMGPGSEEAEEAKRLDTEVSELSAQLQRLQATRDGEEPLAPEEDDDDELEQNETARRGEASPRRTEALIIAEAVSPTVASELLLETDLVDVFGSCSAPVADGEACWRMQLTLRCCCRNRSHRLQAVSLTPPLGQSSCQTLGPANLTWEAKAKAQAGLLRGTIDAQELRRTVSIRLWGNFQDVGPCLRLEDLPLGTPPLGLRLRSEVTFEDGSPIGSFDAELGLDVDLLSFLAPLPRRPRQVQCCWTQVRCSQALLVAIPDALKQQTPDVVLEAASARSAFRIPQPMPQDPPESATLLGAALPVPAGNAKHCRGCCFLVCSGGGGLTASIAVLSASLPVAELVVHALGRRLEEWARKDKGQTRRSV
eukprot:TRINITY_DN25094_c0_g2_i1.p1 TRINITY_DN25094_c0_g2~~TRINITY_DN25094_c0_g2_i1.p1  ORF type:complete len:683 (-),score=149.76 TRINITY_DN25094_c0_g2_i1:124-1914(-)